MKRTLIALMIVSLVVFAAVLFTGTSSLTVVAQQMKGKGMQKGMQGMKGMPMPSAAEKKSLMDLHKQLIAFKADLAKAGKYECCLKDSCSFCALAAAMCPCGGKVAKGEAVCGECKMGWQAGQGNVKGVNAASVKSLDDMMAKMMMDARAMQISGAKGGK